MKVYMVWDQYTDEYFSMVSGELRINRLGAYSYDKKHAAYVLTRVKKMYHSMQRPWFSLMLKEIPIMRVDLTEPTYLTASARLFTSRKLSFYDGLRQLKYEQVRRYNDYINYDNHIQTHALKMALSTI